MRLTVKMLFFWSCVWLLVMIFVGSIIKMGSQTQTTKSAVVESVSPPQIRLSFAYPPSPPLILQRGADGSLVEAPAASAYRRQIFVDGFFEVPPADEWFPKTQDLKINPVGLKVHVFHDLDYGKAHFELVMPTTLSFDCIDIRDKTRDLGYLITPITGGIRIGILRSQAGSERVTDFVLSKIFSSTPRPNDGTTFLDFSLTALGFDGSVSTIPNFRIRLK